MSSQLTTGLEQLTRPFVPQFGSRSRDTTLKRPTPCGALDDPRYNVHGVVNRAERRRADRLGLALPATPTRCRIYLEGWEPNLAQWMWSDPRPQALQRGFIELGELLARLVDDPAVVTLVIPVDVADAVRRREPDVPYTVERGSGLVSGRTMTMPDGRIDVIIRGDPLGAFDEKNVPMLNPEPASRRLIRRGLIHEAQHVVMHQRGSGFAMYDDDAVRGSFNRQLAGKAAMSVGPDSPGGLEPL